MTSAIRIVDRGRGLQLSTSRITVQDLVPYFQRSASHEEIRSLIPILTSEEIAVVERYYQEHREVLDQEDREIRARTAQRKNSPEIEEIIRRGAKKMAALRQEFLKKGEQERNGDHASC
jgi:uncharacterized protein (DUF433 family)